MKEEGLLILKEEHENYIAGELISEEASVFGVCLRIMKSGLSQGFEY